MTTPLTYAQASPIRDQAWPRVGGFTKCRGVSNACDTGQPPTSNGFCNTCNKRVTTLIAHGYNVHPHAALRVSYATYRSLHPSASPKPNRKPRMASRVFTDADLVTFPTPEQVQAAKVPVVAPEPAPMFGPGWAAPLTQMEQVSIGGAPSLPTMSFPRVDPPAATKPAPPAEPWSVDGARERNRTYDADLDTAGTVFLLAEAAGDREGLLEAVDALRLEVATLRAQLRDPAYLRAALARIDAKAAEIATLKARLAELESE